jgi:hypothetical protein
MVRLNTANGYGSVNTGCRRWSNVVTNVGTDITYADSATNGATFTINTTGVYSVSYTDNLNVAADLVISLNSTTLTGIPVTLTQILFRTSSSAGDFPACAAGCVYLTAGDVIRSQTQGAASGVNSSHFTIVRVG